MTKTEPKYEKRKYLSVSTLMSFIRCPRRYFYQKSGIVPLEEAPALKYGTAMHKAVPILLTKGLDEAMKAFMEIWSDDEYSDDKRNIRRAQAQLGHFLFTHSKARSLYSFEAPPRGDIPLEAETSDYEVPAVIDVGLPVPIFVRIDGLVRHRDTHELWGWEFKTASRLDSRMFESMEMGPQVLTYVLALKTVTGQKIKGMMVEGMLIDKSKVDSLTHPILVHDHHLEDITLWLRYWGENLLACEELAEKNVERAIDQAQAFPKNFAGCNSYPLFYVPGYMCEYANLCRPPNWRDMVGYYGIREAHDAVNLTIEGQ